MSTEENLPKFVQIHLIRYAHPGNANRNDLGHAKTCPVGGATRLRWSSQSLKRAARFSQEFTRNLQLGTRSRKIGLELFRSLLGKRPVYIDGNPLDEVVDEPFKPSVAFSVAAYLTYLYENGSYGDLDDINEKAEEIQDLFEDESLSTEELIDVVKAEHSDLLELSHLAFLHREEFEILLEIAEEKASDQKGSGTFINGGSLGKGVVKDEADGIRDRIFNISKPSTDVALFGRMMASQNQFNVDSAVLMNHAFSTTEVSRQEDYFTAVDDINQHDGAGHIKSTDFKEGVMYEYACVDVMELKRNMEATDDEVRNVVYSFIRALQCSAPGGHSTQFGPQGEAEFTLLKKTSRASNAASAFIKPVDKEGNPLEDSIDRLFNYFDSQETYDSSLVEDSLAVGIDEDYGDVEDIEEFILEEGS
jgi:CRISPR system Cascade subunit CasC